MSDKWTYGWSKDMYDQVNKEVTMKDKYYNQGYLAGYRMGLKTGLDFVIKYCIDYQEAMKKKGIDHDKNPENPKK